MDAPRPPINPREYDHLQLLVRQHQLHRFAPDLASFAGIDPKRGASIDVRRYALFKERVESLMQTLRDTGILPSPTLPEGVTFCRQRADNAPIGLPTSANILLVGPSGSGKTTLASQALRAAIIAGADPHIFDFKGDYEYVLHLHQGMTDLSAVPTNPLRRLPFLSPAAQRIAYCDWFLRSFYSGALQTGVLYESTDRVFMLSKTPNLADLKRVVESLYKKTDTYSRRDAIDGIVWRLERIRQILPNVFNTREEGVHREAMRGVYFGASTYTDVAEWLFSYYIVNNAFLINRHAHRRNEFTHLILLDESIFSLSTAQAANRITGINPLAVLLPTPRVLAANARDGGDVGRHRSVGSPELCNHRHPSRTPGRTQGRHHAWPQPGNDRVRRATTRQGRGIIKQHGQPPLLATFDPLPDGHQSVPQAHTNPASSHHHGPALPSIGARS
jgi:hypothetical protein